MHIRKATAADAPQIGLLIAEFQDYLRDLGDTTEFRFNASAYLRDGFVDLYVRQASRRQGIGEALMTHLAAAGRSQGAQALVWSVFKPNHLAAGFYQRLGAQYLENLHWMMLPI